jgi:hypothetical protein
MLQSPRCVSWLLVVLIAVLTPGAARAQRDDGVFRVSGIEVDVTAADAVTARQRALIEGQVEGLQRLLRRLVPAEEHASLPRPTASSVERYVQNFEITNEELSRTRYLATLTVSYDPEAVRELLQVESLSFAETPSAPIVVLPLWQGPDGLRLWPDDNPWWQAWADNLDPERLLRLVLPLGDVEDMVTLTPAQAESGEPGPLTALAERYGAGDVLAVTATPRAGSDATRPVIELTMRRIGRIEQVNPPEIVRGDVGQGQDELLASAVVGLQDQLDERWKSANLLRFDQAGIIVVDIPIAQLADWVQIDDGLGTLPEVSQVEIVTFARDNVRAQIRYIGDELRLEQALARLGLALSREGESWLLRPMGVSPDPGERPSATSTSS